MATPADITKAMHYTQAAIVITEGDALFDALLGEIRATSPTLAPDTQALGVLPLSSAPHKPTDHSDRP